MKDKEVKLEEIEDSDTLGGSGDRRKVVSKGEGIGEGVDATLVSNTLRYFSLADLARGCGLITSGSRCLL